MDAFFASIEQRDNPSLQGMPVVVGADPKFGKGRGVVSTCSYEARRFGVHSAMPISRAYKKCPQAVYLPVDGEKYHIVSEQIYEILNTFSPAVEPVSIDEAFLDISDTYKLFGTPYETCLMLKKQIREKLKLTASVGLAPIKMAAKIASDLSKPDGLIEIPQEKLLDFLWPLDVGKIWGLGPKGQSILKQEGINTIGELARCGSKKLIVLFGKQGINLRELANGKDDREVAADSQVRSIGNETTFTEDVSIQDVIKAELLALCDKVSWRLRHNGFKARTVTLKIRFTDFSTFTRAITLSLSVNLTEALYEQAQKLYALFGNKKQKVRLVGIRASNLCPADEQDNLFPDKQDAKRQNVHKVVDRIRERFGETAIFRAGIYGKARL